MNVLLIESRPLLRLGLSRMLGETPGIDEVGSVDLVDLPGPLDAGHLSASLGGIDLLVLGVPRERGEAWQRLGPVYAALGARYVLLLSAELSLRELPPELAGAVCAWLPESASLERIETAVRALVHVASQSTPSRSVTVRAERQPPIPAMAPPASSRHLPADEARLLQLTQRQYEVLVLLSYGFPLKTVGRRLNISIATVKSHARELYKRLAVRSKSEAVYAARRLGARLEWYEALPAARMRFDDAPLASQLTED